MACINGKPEPFGYVHIPHNARTKFLGRERDWQTDRRDLELRAIIDAGEARVKRMRREWPLCPDSGVALILSYDLNGSCRWRCPYHTPRPRVRVIMESDE